MPCFVHDDVVFSELDADERVRLLSTYNKQRDKSHAEKLREAILEIEPDQAYQSLLRDRVDHRHQINDNVSLGCIKKRSRITTIAFLVAAQNAVESERDFWPITVRRVHYLLLNAPPLRHDKKPGSTYQNDLNSYKALTNLLTRARLTGDIPPGAAARAKLRLQVTFSFAPAPGRTVRFPPLVPYHPFPGYSGNVSICDIQHVSSRIPFPSVLTCPVTVAFLGAG